MSLPLRSSRPPRISQPTNRDRAAASNLLFVIVKITFVLLLCGSSYLAGSLFGHQSLDSAFMHAPMSVGRLIHGEESLPGKDSDNAVYCEEAEKEFIESKVKEELKKHGKKLEAKPNNSASSETRRFPKTVEKVATGMARIKKDDLNMFFDFGNPMDVGESSKWKEALMIYQSTSAVPSTDKLLSHSTQFNDGPIPLIDPKTATENCDAMNVIFTGNPGNTRQCTAIIGNFESYHIDRWMRVDTTKSTPITPELPLVHVSRGYASRGKANFYAPPSDGKFSPVRRHWTMLRTFLQNVDSVLDDLKPILKKVARNNAIVVLTCNMGQSALLMNFACSARRRGFDLGNILVFPSDVETKELAEGLGLATYYDAKVCPL